MRYFELPRDDMARDMAHRRNSVIVASVVAEGA